MNNIMISCGYTYLNSRIKYKEMQITFLDTYSIINILLLSLKTEVQWPKNLLLCPCRWKYDLCFIFMTLIIQKRYVLHASNKHWENYRYNFWISFWIPDTSQVSVLFFSCNSFHSMIGVLVITFIIIIFSTS